LLVTGDAPTRTTCRAQSPRDGLGVVAGPAAPVAFRRMSQQSLAPGWYPDPSGTGSRYWDGKDWGPTAPPPTPAQSKKWVPAGLIVAGILAVVVAIGTIGYHWGSSSRSSSTTTVGATPPQPPHAGIGQEVGDGNFRFVVTSVDVSKTAGDPGSQFQIAPKQGEFVNVHLTVRNVGDRPQTFYAYNQTLQIGTSQFSSNTAATMWKQAMTVDINPGSSIQAVVSFDVPPGASKDGVLTLRTSLASGGTRISLRQPKQ
jgi:hypothetical protein